MCVKFTLMEERSVSAHWGKQLLKHTWTRTQTVTRQPFQKRQSCDLNPKKSFSRMPSVLLRLLKDIRTRILKMDMMEWGMRIFQIPGKYFVNRCTFQSVRLESSLVSKRKPVKRLNGKTSYIRKHSPCWNPLEIASSTILLLWFLFRFLTQPQNIWIWVHTALLSSHWLGILIWEMGVTDYLSGQDNRGDQMKYFYGGI